VPAKCDPAIKFYFIQRNKFAAQLVILKDKNTETKVESAFLPCDLASSTFANKQPSSS
jgi:hypothetical protein